MVDWLCEIDWSAGVSAIAGIGSLAVAFAVFWLERKAKEAKRPRLTLWIESGATNPMKVSVFNWGAEPVVVRRLDVESLRYNYGVFVGGGSFSGQNMPLDDFVIETSRVYPLLVMCNGMTGGHFTLRFQLFSGQFRKLEIDPAKLGPYQLEF